MKEKIGLIGVGNMGTSILEGVFEKGLAKPGQVWVFDKVISQSTAFAKKRKVRKASSLEQLLKNSKMLILAIKPQDLKAVAEEIRPFLKKTHCVMSILAGTPIAKIKKYFGKSAKVIRVMPNLGAKVGEGVSVLTGPKGRALSLAKKIFSGCGQTLELNEKHFDLVTAVSGSGPAYFFLIMELLANYGRTQGLSQKNAELLAIQTALGSAKLASLSSLSPEQLRKMVTSKKGTTDAALTVFKKSKLSKIFDKALGAAQRRGRELSSS